MCQIQIFVIPAVFLCRAKTEAVAKSMDELADMETAAQELERDVVTINGQIQVCGLSCLDGIPVFPVLLVWLFGQQESNIVVFWFTMEAAL